MKTIGLVANLDRDIDSVYLKEVADWILSRGLLPIIREGDAKSLGSEYRTAAEDELYKLSDMIVTLGGDGTIIGASKKAAMYNTAIMGINLGTLGYLTDAACGVDGIEALGKVLDGEFKIDKRMMLEASVLDERGNVIDDGLLALNEVCILRGMFPRAKSYSLHINGDYLDVYKGDGIIIATPTGSTAYNLSAGGSILSPDMECIAITPISPHKMNSRPLVVSADDILNIDIDGDYEHEDRSEVMLSLDCQVNIDIEKGQSVRVERSKKYLRLIKTNDLGFYDILRKKMH